MFSFLKSASLAKGFNHVGASSEGKTGFFSYEAVHVNTGYATYSQ